MTFSHHIRPYFFSVTLFVALGLLATAYTALPVTARRSRAHAGGIADKGFSMSRGRIVPRAAVSRRPRRDSRPADGMAADEITSGRNETGPDKRRPVL